MSWAFVTEDGVVGIFSKSKQPLRTRAAASERVRFEEPVMDRELPMVFLAAVLAAVALVAVQFQLSSSAKKKEATTHSAFHTVQKRPDARLASSQLTFADAFEHRAH